MASRSQASAFTKISTQTTTQVKTGPGVLQRITINTPANTGTITIYDNVAADTTNPIAVITSKTADPPGTLLYGVRFTNGLKIVTATASNDLTVVWD